MQLAIDIGNTRTKYGLFKGADLIQKWTLSTLDLSFIKEQAYNHHFKKVILSTVGDLPVEAATQLSKEFSFLQLTHTTPLPIKNQYTTPKTLGKDRLAGVMGAFDLFPQNNCLVIDAGTCITYDFLRADGTYLGGNIAPGLDMRLRAMHQQTAKLPLVERRPMEDLLGNSTETALLNGALLGSLLEVEGFMDRCTERFGAIMAIFTGGDAIFFEKHLKRKIFVNQNLVLEGLNKILDYNVKQLD